MQVKRVFRHYWYTLYPPSIDNFLFWRVREPFMLFVRWVRYGKNRAARKAICEALGLPRDADNTEILQKISAMQAKLHTFQRPAADLEKHTRSTQQLADINAQIRATRKQAAGQ